MHNKWGVFYETKEFVRKDDDGNKVYRRKGVWKYTLALFAERPFRYIDTNIINSLLCVGSVCRTSSDPEEYDRLKASGTETFNKALRTMERDIDYEETCDIVKMFYEPRYKKWKVAITAHRLHFVDEHSDHHYDAWEKWSYRLEDCILCTMEKKEKENRKKNYYEKLNANKGSKWMVNNLMPPIGHTEWTPEALDEQLKALKVSRK